MPPAMTAIWIGWTAVLAAGSDEAARAEWLGAHARDPVQYIVEQFDRRDVVVLGEVHEWADNCLFVAELLAPAYREAGVRLLFSEFWRSRDQEALRRIVTAERFDRDAAVGLMRDYAWPTWGFEEYLGIAEAVWRVNRDRPAGAEPMLLVGLDSDWRQEQMLDGGVSAQERMRLMLDRERHMAETIVKTAVEPGRKALVHTGFAHALPIEPRVGAALRRAAGDRVWLVCLHQSLSHDQPRSLVSASIEAAATQAGLPRAGFDVDGPMADLRDAASLYFTHGGDRSLKDLADGYVLLAPLDRMTRIRWVEGFINADNFARARDLSVRMGLVSSGDTSTPRQLDAALKAAFEHR